MCLLTSSQRKGDTPRCSSTKGQDTSGNQILPVAGNNIFLATRRTTYDLTLPTARTSYPGAFIWSTMNVMFRCCQSTIPSISRYQRGDTCSMKVFEALRDKTKDSRLGSTICHYGLEPLFNTKTL